MISKKANVLYKTYLDVTLEHLKIDLQEPLT